MEKLLDVVVVGYGVAGHVHANTYRNLTGTCRLAGIVELCRERHPAIEKQFSDVSIFESLEQALTGIDGDVVVDLCVPAPQNIALVEQAIAFGVRKIMLEKPLGWSLPMAITLADILRDSEAIYLDTYQFSLGVKQLQSWIVREKSEIDRVHIKFNKNRITDSFNCRGFDDNTAPDAWHIEGPHMVTIAMKIAGKITAIEDACFYDMKHNDRILANHGGASATVKHSNGVSTFLSTDLCSDENERLVEVFLKNQVCLRLSLPASKMTQLVSQIEKIDHGCIVDTYTVEDRPMEQCVTHSIDYFLTKNNHAQMIGHGVVISEILQKLTEASNHKSCSNAQLDVEGIIL